MAELVLFAEFGTWKDAKTHALVIVEEHGQSPTMRRSGPGWALFVSQTLLERLRSKPKASAKAIAKAAPTAGTPRRPARASGAHTLDQSSDAVATSAYGTNDDAKRDIASDVLGAGPSERKSNWAMSAEDARRMAGELRHAYRKLSAADATGWLNRTTKKFAHVFARRVQNLAGLTLSITEATGSEIRGLIKAVWENRATDHIVRRIGAAAGTSAAFAKDIRDKAKPLINDLRRDPASVAPDLLIGALAFYLSGGGLDGDGGIPDTDIPLLGIGAHRSVFTHSIIAGAVVETALYSLVDFIGVAYHHLPDGHDERWTLIHDRLEGFATTSVKGVSLGLAYHLGVDGLLQPGAYHDIPFEMPIEGHQTILTANAIAEGMDVKQKEDSGAANSKAAPDSGRLTNIFIGAGAIATFFHEEFF